MQLFNTKSNQSCYINQKQALKLRYLRGQLCTVSCDDSCFFSLPSGSIIFP